MRGQAYNTSRKSRTHEVGTDYKSALPLWDQSQKLQHWLPHYLLTGEGKKQDVRLETWQIREATRASRVSDSTVPECRYLCLHPCLLLTSLAFGVSDYCTWSQPPVKQRKKCAARSRNNMTTKRIHQLIFFFYFHDVCWGAENKQISVPSDSWGWPEDFLGETAPVCWRWKGCRPATLRKISNWCQSRQRSLGRSSAASLWLTPRCRRLCCSPLGRRNPPGLSILWGGNK